MAATSTTGLVGANSCCRKKAVSSSVSVPWVTTTPATSGRARWWASRVASASHTWKRMSLLSSCATCSASSGWPVRAGTTATSCATPSWPAV